MTIGALDTNSVALKTRLELQEKLSSFDLNQWIFAHFPDEAGQRWLDLGCGRGKQSIALSRAGCRVTAVDISIESLEALKAEAPDVRTIRADLDDFDAWTDGRYDRAIGIYSLYYSKDHPGLFAGLARVTSELFFCGPAHANNMELRQLIADVTGNNRVLEPTAPSRFMEDTGPAIARDHFADVERFTFENEVSFSSPADLIAYWSSHNLHDAAFDDQFRRAAEGLSMPFVNRKRGIGIRAVR